jgi:HlyD family secretion protein
MKKKLVLAAVAIALGGGVATIVTVRARPDPTSRQIELNGNVDIRQVSLAFTTSERVTEMRVTEGDHVKAGQVLAVLDTHVLELRKQQAQAQAQAYEQTLSRLKAGSRPEDIAQAKARLDASKAESEFASQQLARLEDVQASTQGKGLSQQDLDSARSRSSLLKAQMEVASNAHRLAVSGPRIEEIKQAEAQAKAANAEVDLLDHQIHLAELKAPMDAVVRSRLLEPGDIASPQRPAYALLIANPKWVRVYVSEVDLIHMKPGQAVSITTDGAPDHPLKGTIGYVSSVAEFTPKTVQTTELRTSLVYEVRVRVDDDRDELRLGMPATVRVPLTGGASPEKVAKP